MNASVYPLVAYPKQHPCLRYVVEAARKVEYAVVRERLALARQDFLWAARWAAFAEDQAEWAFAMAPCRSELSKS